MKATLAYVKQKFDEYNRTIFKGALAPLPMRIGSSKTQLGSVRFKKRKTASGQFEFYDFVLTISNRVDLPENELEDVIIHEMIHYYILGKQLHDSSPHGKLFRQLMAHINAHFNRRITISHKNAPGQAPKDGAIKPHFICISELADGRTGLTVSAKTRLFQNWDLLPKHFSLKSYAWYWSTDPYFNRFPSAIKPKIYIVDAQEVKEHLKEAKTLIREGNTIRAKK